MLVLRSSAAGADGVALNRPLAARGNRQLAELLLRQTGEAEALVGPLLAISPHISPYLPISPHRR